MIEVTVSYLPSGVRHRAEEIASLEITNISDLADCSDYQYILRAASSPLTLRGAETHHGIVRGHNRREGNIWTLVQKILEKNRDWL